MTRWSPSAAFIALVQSWVLVPMLAGCVADDGAPDQPESSSAAGTSGNAGPGGTSGAGGTDVSPACIPPGTGGFGGAVDADPSSGNSTGADGGGIDNGASGEPYVRLEGRFDFSESTTPGFSWSGSAMFARFEGTGAILHMDGGANQFAVVIDGAVAAGVLKVTSGTTDYAVASGLGPGVHDLVIWRRTEGNQGRNRFLGLDVVGGQLQMPPTHADRRVEIYGDSITAGYGIDGVGPSCAWSPDTENHYLTYGAVAARELDAELHTVAWSGIGMYRNYDKTDASPDAMPYVYERILAQTSASRWNFTSWQPHAVVINLGTNDVSTHGDPGTGFRAAYLDFVRNLRQKYPSTFFVLTVGPMLDGANLGAIKSHLQAVIDIRSCEGDSRLTFLEFPVQSVADGYGCDWHPSPKTNAKMAALLVAKLRTALGW